MFVHQDFVYKQSKFSRKKSSTVKKFIKNKFQGNERLVPVSCLSDSGLESRKSSVKVVKSSALADDDATPKFEFTEERQNEDGDETVIIEEN